MNLWTDLEVGKKPPAQVNAVIEIPQGCKNKYEYDVNNGVFTLDRVLYAAEFYPGDYGFIPKTLHEDGDPLDILVLTYEPTFTGCVVPARVIGVLDMEDQNGPDAKILAVPEGEPRFQELKDIKDVATYTLKEIEYFFETYKQLENKKVTVHNIRDRKAAEKIILDSITRYNKRWA